MPHRSVLAEIITSREAGSKESQGRIEWKAEEKLKQKHKNF